MNKAFVREVDSNLCRCPRCSAAGIAVGADTLQAHLPPELRSQLTETAWFCPFPRCEVVYFDEFERALDQAALGITVYPKDPTAPICACFGLTCEEIEADVGEGTVTRTRALLERAKSSEASCATKSFTGQSCIAEVQRYYLKIRAAWQG